MSFLIPPTMMKVYIFLISMFGIFPLFAQKMSVGISGGTALYHGDLVPTSISLKGAKYAFGLSGHYELSRWFSAQVNTSFGKLSGSDFFYNVPERTNRGLSFSANYMASAVIVEWQILGRGRLNSNGIFVKSWSPSIGLGIGYVTATPQVVSAKDSSPNLIRQRVNALSLPLSFSLRRHFSPKSSYFIALSYHFTNTDSLDGYLNPIKDSANDGYKFISLGFNFYFNAPKKAFDDGM